MSLQSRSPLSSRLLRTPIPAITPHFPQIRLAFSRSHHISIFAAASIPKGTAALVAILFDP